MASPMPIASYLFILRKHRWLVLGVVVLVLASGWYYARQQPEIFRSSAKVQIERSLGSGTQASTRLVSEDATFVANILHRLREDGELHTRVLARLNDEKNPDVADRSILGKVKTGNIASGLSVRRIDPTSYYQISYEGGNPELNTAVANAFAEEFQATFQEEKQRQISNHEREYRHRIDEKRTEEKALLDSLQKVRADNPHVDFRLEGGRDPDQENLESVKKALLIEQNRLRALEGEERTVLETLKAVGITLGDDAKGNRTLFLGGGSGEPQSSDLRLNPRVLNLGVVSRNERVRDLHGRIAKNREDDDRLAYGVGARNPQDPNRVLLQQNYEGLLRDLANAAEAALLELDREVRQVRETVRSLEKDRVALGERAIASVAARSTHERLSDTVAELRESIKADETLLRDFARQFNQLGNEMEEGGGIVRVIERATLSGSRFVRPNRPLMYLVTAVVALLAAAALAYALEFLDDTVKSREDFDRLVRLPFLGFVPHVRRKEGKGGEEAPSADNIAARGKTGSPEVEAFRSIRTGIQFSRPDREVHVFLVTSAGPGEGKTTMSVNLAATFAGGGRVLLIDADLRRARIHSALGIDNKVGLTNVLVGSMPLTTAVQKSTIEGLDILASGPIPPNPAEVLGGARMKAVIEEARGIYDRVIIDSPPIVAVTDPVLIAKFVDAVFLVVSVGRTSVRLIQRAKETLASAGVVIHGAILNNSDLRHSGYYGYRGYGYGYGYGYAYGYGYGYPSKDAEKEADEKK